MEIQSERRVTRTDHPHIVRIEGRYGGDPVIEGAGISVQAIVEHTHLGLSPQGIANLYPGQLNLAQVHDALSYYYDYQQEIDEGIAKNLAILANLPGVEYDGAKD